jgi:hypothetical protein
VRTIRRPLRTQLYKIAEWPIAFEIPAEVTTCKPRDRSIHNLCQ